MKKLLSKSLLFALLALMPLMLGATGQPVGKLVIVATEKNFWHEERGVGAGVNVYVYNRFGHLAVTGTTNDVSAVTFTLPPDTYVIYVLHDLRVNSFWGNDCYTAPQTVREGEQTNVIVTCHKRVWLDLPFAATAGAGQ